MKQAGRRWVDVCHCYIDASTDPWGLQPSTPLKAINPWPTVPCTVPSTASLSHTHARIYIQYTVYIQQETYKKIAFFCFTLQAAQSHKQKEIAFKI